MSWGVKGEVENWRAVKVIVKEENEEGVEEDEQPSDESDGEEVVQSRWPPIDVDAICIIMYASDFVSGKSFEFS